MTGSAPIWIGTALMAGGTVLLAVNLRFVRRSRLTTATVVGYRESRSTSSDDGAAVYFFPIFEFTTEKGQVVRGGPNTGEGEPAWPIGEKVPVRYLPERPEKVQPAGARFVLVFPLATVALGVFFIVLGSLQ